MAHVDNEILRRSVLELKDQARPELVGDAIRRLPGVARVETSDAGKTLFIWYDPSSAAPDQFINIELQKE